MKWREQEAPARMTGRLTGLPLGRGAKEGSGRNPEKLFDEMPHKE
jgi:hypothetical protein